MVEDDDNLYLRHFIWLVDMAISTYQMQVPKILPCQKLVAQKIQLKY